MKTLTRSNCFIGKGNWPTDGFSSSFVDDLRFYNKSLTQTEIQQLMNQVCKKFHFIETFNLKNLKLKLKGNNKRSWIK